MALAPSVCLAVLLAVFAMACGAGPAAAQSEADLFVVTDVPVDETGKSAVEAREKAIAAGQVKALRMVMERIVAPDMVDRLPTVSAADVQPMVQAIEINNERTAGARYRGNLTVRFFPDAVRDVMGRASIPFASKPARPTLVLPVYTAGSVDTLWEEPNPWREAWSTYGRGSPLVPLLVPFGELGDVQAISARDALQGATAPLESIAQRYDVKDVVLAHAVAAPGGDGMEIEVSRYWSGGTLTPVDSFPATSGDAGMQAAVDRVIARMADTVRTGEALRPRTTAAPTTYGGSGTAPAGGGSLSTRIAYSDLQQWVRIGQVLAKVDLIQGLQVDAVSAGGAQVVLNFRGTTDQLRDRLQGSNLMLRNDGPYWALSVLDPTREIAVPMQLPAGAAGGQPMTDTAPPPQLRSSGTATPVQR